MRVSDVVIVAATVASLIHCYGTVYVHIELGECLVGVSVIRGVSSVVRLCLM